MEVNFGGRRSAAQFQPLNPKTLLLDQLRILLLRQCGVSEIRVPYWGPYYKGILLFKGLYWGPLILVSPHIEKSPPPPSPKKTLNPKQIRKPLAPFGLSWASPSQTRGTEAP